MSSPPWRSTPLFPPSASNRKEIESGGTLSKDALYAPLSTYADSSYLSNHNRAIGTSTPKKSSPHSLSIQSKLTIPSLVASLTGISQNLKTSHPREYQLYRSIGGSIARLGTGDNDCADGDRLRGTLEAQLSHRNLVLVGGGVHSHANSALTTPVKDNEMSVVGLGMAHAALSGKRERKRTGGSGVFGSISNKRRKRILREKSKEGKSKLNSKSGLKTSQCDPAKVHETVGSTIKTLHEMWIHYIRQLLDNGAVSMDSLPWLTSKSRKQMSTILATAEHVGMPATIVECPSRRHLINFRCVVVNETKETWKVAMISRKRNNKHKSKESGETSGKNIHETDVKDKTSMLSFWKIILVPKHGTTLEVELPWVDSSISKDPQSKNGFITFRLET